MQTVKKLFRHLRIRTKVLIRQHKQAMQETNFAYLSIKNLQS